MSLPKLSRTITRSYLVGLTLAAIAFGGARRAEACGNDVYSHSSPPDVIHNPRVHDVFWGASFWNAATSARGEIDATWNDLANNATWWQRLAEYGVGGGSFAGSTIQDPPVVQGTGLYVSEQDIEGTLSAEIEAGNISGSYDGNDLYVIYLPPGVYSAYDDSNSAIGHHQTFSDSFGRRIRWAVIEFGPTAQMTETSSHEIAEAATDPDLNGYWQDSNGAEIADLCEDLAPFAWDGHEIVEIWSQDGCGCITTPPAPPTNPCDKLPPAERTCCEKPFLPMCNR